MNRSPARGYKAASAGVDERVEVVLSASLNWDWLFWIGGLLIMGAGVVMVGVGLFSDRARGRRRCPRCWYDMSGATETDAWTCPECGRAARRRGRGGARELLRTRRHPIRIYAGIILISVGFSIRATPRVGQRGPVAAVPTSVLVLIAPIEAPLYELSPRPFRLARDPLLVELLGRVDRRETWSWQTRIFASRIAQTCTDRREGLPDLASRAALESLGRPIESGLVIPGEATLGDAFELLTLVTGVRVRVERDAERAPLVLDVDEPVYLEVRAQSAAAALDELVRNAQGSWWWDVHEGEVVVTPSPPGGDVRTWVRVHRVADVVGAMRDDRRGATAALYDSLDDLVPDLAERMVIAETIDLAHVGSWLVVHAGAQDQVLIAEALEEIRAIYANSPS